MPRIWNQIKNRNIFFDEKVLEEHFVRIYKIHLYFYEHYKEKMQVDKNGGEYIFFRTDAYFTEYLLAVEIDAENHANTDLTFWGEKTRSTRKRTWLQIY